MHLLETSIFISLILYGLISSKLYINNITTLELFALGAQKLLPSVQNLYKSFTMLKAYKGVDFQLTKLLNKKDESVYYKNQKSYQIPNKIKFINVNFAYKNSKQKILDNINFEINSGNKVGIFGTAVQVRQLYLMF